MSASREPTFIRAWRVHRGLSLEELAARAAMGKGNLSRLERGLLPYTQATIERLADALNCSPSELIARHPEEAEAFWAMLERATPEQRARIGVVAEAMIRSEWERHGPPTDADAPAPGREAARRIGPGGRPR